MARYAYDVNTTQRYIDVHKQFQGGLKTVDTDDALGAVFLREAENISLSEFGFLEKRYGTYENFKAALSVDTNSNLQGYWEFMGKYIVVALNGFIYFQLLSTPETAFTKIDTLYKVAGLKYPEDIAQHLLATVETDAYIGGIDFFQNTRPMGATNIANVLYIFTGKYPIYLVEESNTLKAYLFSIEDPTFAEIVVTGHNLLENDYDGLYYGENFDLEPITIDREEEGQIQIIDDVFYPKLPFAKDGDLNFNFSYDAVVDIVEPFVFDTQTQPESTLNTISLKSLKYRPSGPGATDLSFLELSPTTYNSNILNNVSEDIVENVDIVGTALTWNNIVNTISTNYLTETSYTQFIAKQRYWSNYLDDIGENDVRRQLELKQPDTFVNLFTLDYKDVEIEIDDIPTATFTSGNTLAFAITDGNENPINFENKLTQAKTALTSYSLNDSRQNVFVTSVFATTVLNVTRHYYNLYYKNNDTLIPVYSFAKTETGNIGDARMTYSFKGSTFDRIEVSLYNKQGNLFRQEFVSYKKPDGSTSLLSVSNLRRAFPMVEDERTSYTSALSKINEGTVLQLIEHDSNHAEDIILATYRIGSGLTFENGYYKFVLPEGLPPQGINHYVFRFKTTDVNISTTINQNTYLSQTFDIDDFYTADEGQDAVLITFDQTSLNPIKSFFPNISQFIAVTNALYQTFVGNDWYLFPVESIVDIESKDEIGSSLLNVLITEGLLSGTYDFQFVYQLTQEQINYSNLAKQSVAEPFEFSYVVKDITVTEEKLTDYTFFQGSRAHPIWSCNSVLEHFGKLMVYGSEEMPTALFYSFPDRPFYFPSFFYLDFTNEENKPLVSVTPFMNILVVQTEDQTWGVRGNSGLITAPSPYAEFGINNTVGTIAPKSVRPVRNHLFFLSKQGVIALKSLYAADEQYNIDFVDRNIRNIVPQDSDAVGVQYDNQYWLNFPNFGITLRWYIDKKAWVLDRFGSYVDKLGNLQTKVGAWNQFNGVFKYQVKDGKLEFITHPSRFTENESLSVYKVGVDYTLPTDLGGIVSTKFETSFLNQNYPFHPKNYKEAKFDFTLQNEYNISRDSIYEMDFAEHIADGITHTIDNVNLTKNHRYRIVYNFSDHNIDEDIVSGGDFTGANIPTDVVEGGSFTTAPTILFGALSFSILGAQDLQIESVQIKDNEGDIKDVDFNIYSDDTYDYYIDFLLPNSVDGILDIIVTGEFSSYNDGAIMYDITYDSNLVFYNWVISEDRTLNLDNIESYDQSKAELNIDFNGRLGNWVFGSSDFGNKVTAVKTEKLSGKGYNAKVYVEDFSRSKWTLESLGLTYKMKRARSR